MQNPNTVQPLPGGKLLYLDYDGVLHDDQVVICPHNGIVAATPGRVLFEWVPILEQLLAHHPDVSIVLSTSWVHVRGIEYAKQRLSPDLQQRVIGATFDLREIRRDEFSLMSRGQQIARDVFRRGPQSWCAIDDDDSGWPSWCRDNLIKTTGSLGISDPKIQYAISVMLQRF